MVIFSLLRRLNNFIYKLTNSSKSNEPFYRLHRYRWKIDRLEYNYLKKRIEPLKEDEFFDTWVDHSFGGRV